MKCASTSEGEHHTGVDFFVKPGTPVYAICDGVVHHDASQRSDIWNRCLIVKHQQCGSHETLYAYYGHIDALVDGKGAKVMRGQHIASVKKWPGDTHLHFGISTSWFPKGWGYQQGDPLKNGWLNPEAFLRSSTAFNERATINSTNSTILSKQVTSIPRGVLSSSLIRQSSPRRTSGEYRKI